MSKYLSAPVGAVSPGQNKEGVPWWRDAACRHTDSEMFFPSDGDNEGVGDARRVCARCPVVTQCLQDALIYDNRYGVRGGTTPSQRSRMGGRSA
jgi:WhiB family redox-sensing transcriptional regulator